MSLQEIESILKSCIISKKDDTTLQELNKEYHELVGQHIPFEKYGYQCLEDFINQLDGVHLRRNLQGCVFVTASTEKAGHIASLVARQKKTVYKAPKKKRVVLSPKTVQLVPSRRLSTLNKQAVTHGNRKSPLGKRILQYGIISSAHNNLRSQEPISCETRLVNYSSVASHGQGGHSTDIEEFSGVHSNGGHLVGSEEFSGVLSSSSSRSNSEGYGERGGRYTPNIGPARPDILNFSSSSESLSSVVCNVLHQSSSKSKAKNLSFPSRTSQCNKKKSLFYSSGDLSSQREYYFSDLESSEDWLQSVVHSCSNDHYRLVRLSNNSIQCVVSSYPNSSIKELFMSNQCSRWENGPVMLDFHLVGDDFLLHFAYESLIVDCKWEDEGIISCGMCISGQTISGFHMQLYHEEEIKPRIVMMLGSVDILQGSSLPQIINDMMDLLNEISSVVECVVLLTLPFLVNGGIANQIVLHFNEFLRSLDNGHHVRVVDVHTLFKARKGYVNERSIEEFINYKCYERYRTSTVNIPGGITLWSHLGRSIVYNSLIQKLPGINRALLIES